MITRRLVAASLVASTLIGAGLIAGMGQPDKKAEPKAAAAASGSYSVDPIHSNVIYKIKHMGVSNFYGRFNKVSGSFSWDPAKPEATTADISIDVESIDTNNSKRDSDVKASVFSAKEFPTITFKSKSMKKAGDTWDFTGDLTMHGKTKEVVAKFTPVGEKSTDRGNLAGFEAHFKVMRSDFGMAWGVDNGALGDEVHIMASFEGRGK
jgi:polyisoprenoid-binding protein YceI